MRIFPKPARLAFIEFYLYVAKNSILIIFPVVRIKTCCVSKKQPWVSCRARAPTVILSRPGFEQWTNLPVMRSASRCLIVSSSCLTLLDSPDSVRSRLCRGRGVVHGPCWFVSGLGFSRFHAQPCLWAVKLCDSSCVEIVWWCYFRVFFLGRGILRCWGINSKSCI